MTVRRPIEDEVAEARDIDPGDLTRSLDVLDLTAEVRDLARTRDVPGHNRSCGRQIVATGVVLALPVSQPQPGQGCRESAARATLRRCDQGHQRSPFVTRSGFREPINARPSSACRRSAGTTGFAVTHISSRPNRDVDAPLIVARRTADGALRPFPERRRHDQTQPHAQWTVSIGSILKSGWPQFGHWRVHMPIPPLGVQVVDTKASAGPGVGRLGAPVEVRAHIGVGRGHRLSGAPTVCNGLPVLARPVASRPGGIAVASACGA
jgi:hypothetical protein